MKLAGLAVLLATLMVPLATTASEARLFRDHEPIRLRLEIDLSGLCWKSDQLDCGEVSATLVQLGRYDRTRTFHVRVRSRGNFRMSQQQCTAPLMFIRFFKNDSRGSVFEGQNMLPLTTQCAGDRARYRDYVLNEYLAYRIYESLTRMSLRSRPVRLDIVDKGHKLPGNTLSGFFTEHFDDMARRNRSAGKAFETFDPALTDPLALSVMTLFQYMIGNTDWSVIDGHNITYIEQRNGTPFAVPYDFDFSGLVDADYAGPPPNLPIRSVRQRIYRGFCFDGLDWADAYRPFLDQQEFILALPSELVGMTGDARRASRQYLAQFYQVIESERLRESKIESACRNWVN